MTNLENLATAIGKDIKDIKTRFATKEEMHEIAEKKQDKDTVVYNDTEVKQRLTTLENKPNIDTSNFVTNEQLEAKHYLTEHQPLTHLATTSDLEVLRNISVNKAELSKKLDSTEFDSFKDSVVTKTELAGKGYLTQPYNDSEVKQRLTTLENRSTGDGSQKKDTGWITIKDGNDETGNILKIRRIEDMVHVQISNKSEYGLTIKGGYLGYNFAGYSLPTIGFNTPTSILLPMTKSPQHIEDNSSHIDVLGQAIFNVKNGELTMNVFTNSGQEQEDETHINSFSYFTEDLFPTD